MLCKTQDRKIAQYVLSGMDKPMGVAEYELLRALPEPLLSNLPTVDALESERSGDMPSLAEVKRKADQS